MNNPTYTEEYKGYKINIYPDQDCQSPQEWGDNDLFLVNYHRDFTVEKDSIITKEDVQQYYETKKIAQSKDYHIFPLSMLSHSGVWLSLAKSFPSDGGGWDTSHVGVVLVAKKEFRTVYKALGAAEGLIETWNDYLSGNVYGYEVPKTGDACWGYSGDYETSGILDDAKANIDFWIKNGSKDKPDENTIRITVKDGAVVNVEGLPNGYQYEIEDQDN